ncbi:MAG: hypothetical protein ACRDJH_01520 [Thermomicrobiales bacterium]
MGHMRKFGPVTHDASSTESTRNQRSREAQAAPDEARQTVIPIGALASTSGEIRARLLRSLARTHGNRHVQRLLAPTVQRLTVLTPGAGMGHRPNDPDDDSRVLLEPRAFYWVKSQAAARAEFGDGQVASISLPPGTEGVLQIALRTRVDVDNAPPFGNVEHDQSSYIHWPARVAPDGAVSVSEALPIQYGEKDPTLQLFVGSIEATNKAGAVEIAVNVVSTTSHSRTNVLTPIGLGAEMSDTVGNRTWPRQFRLLIPGAEPRPVPKATTRVAAEHDVFFGPGSSSFEQSQADGLVEWYGELPEEVREAIRAGRGSIQLDGYASSTGRSAANVDLADRRNQAVMARLRAQAGGDRAFQDPPPVAHGEEPAKRKTGDRQEASEWRRVHIRIVVTDRPE